MRVGTSAFIARPSGRGRDHPHACGDKSFSADVSLKYSGSSPCVWGQGKRSLRMPAPPRIIPMRVGTRIQLSTVLTVS